MSAKRDALGWLIFVLCAVAIAVLFIALGGCASTLKCPPCPPPPEPVTVYVPVPIPCTPPIIAGPYLVLPRLDPATASARALGEAIRHDAMQVERHRRELRAALAACTEPVPD